ncbi:hypothetical protein H0H93_010524, partial [Arthromyces matolae]
CLIDFDYAKVVNDWKPTFMKSVQHLKFDPNVVSYLESRTFSNLKMPPMLTPEDLGFFGPMSPATLPFTSPEILHQSHDTPHDLRHDLESFFWCMTFICITRNGPGGQRREELRSDFKGEITVKVKALRVVNYTLFSADIYTLWDNKAELFKNPTHFEKYIMPHFHTYFDPLKPLMERWWKILHLAHRYRMLETMHLFLQHELKLTSEALRSTKPTPENAEQTKKILEQRKEQLTKLRTAPSSTQAQQSDVEAGIPPSRQGTFDLSPSSGRIDHEESKYHGGEPPASPTPDTGRRMRPKLG